ncbi:Oligoxyloglucan reducing end-specific cellobiohydrolase [Glarea lozoyensis ATCC 20868]|uniref:Oligoxyloglucan reducing end-specific cellobiohydrolase n=1 Tax=Glarea lozoyensis (strain ATCC 20868 / MF5171) TaxID=1116229 RepID=S3CT19_GLAL2|nr:Oligoxyloglucan reducing end-specific cellobiohydrolase [Glarea lozoyensis ATCC 20868]EPE28209.1 Oligoxyloglucan reducing end-specific cellobiohydrolase [Glarea lozoyensis ATCC 20868]
MILLFHPIILAGLVIDSPFLGRNTPLYDTFDNVTVYTAPTEWKNRGTMYGRVVLLNKNCEKNNVLLSTWTVSAPNKTYLPIYKSLDLGRTWNPLSKVYFKTPNYTAIAEPFLYELGESFGDYPAGTVLLSANTFSKVGTAIELHASVDKGKTFEYVSTVATGGPPNVTDGGTSVWEPFILAHSNKLGVFYSDSRDPLHSQKLSHQTSTDLLHWSQPVNDAASQNYTLRPGMTTIAKMGNGKFILFYELDKVTGVPAYAKQPVHYRIADSPFKFNGAREHMLVSTDGTVASSAPQTIWTPAGGVNGTILTSASHAEDFFINTAYGDPSAWIRVDSGHGVGYSRALEIMPNTDGKVVLVFNGGSWQDGPKQALSPSTVTLDFRGCSASNSSDASLMSNSLAVRANITLSSLITRVCPWSKLERSPRPFCGVYRIIRIYHPSFWEKFLSPRPVFWAFLNYLMDDPDHSASGRVPMQVGIIALLL